MMKYALSMAVAGMVALSLQAVADDSVKVLYVTGGGWHDYAGQIAPVQEAIEAAIPGAQVTVSKVKGHGGDNNRHPAFRKDDWHEGYDLVVYNKCNAPRHSDPEWIERIVRPHREGLPAVIIHGTLHNFWPDENESGAWVAFLGITSRNHERHAPLDVTVTATEHEIMQGVPESWRVERGELYRVHGMADGVETLATGVSSENEPYTVVWTHKYGDGRVFGTSLAHATETFQMEPFQRLLRQGISWSLKR